MNQRQPSCNRIEKKLEIHGDVRIDPYYWLNNRENPEVIAYLEAENAYFKESMHAYSELEAQLFEEMKARIKPEEESAPVKYKNHLYYSRFLPGLEYALRLRKEISTNKEEILLDENQLATGRSYFVLGSYSISPNDEWIVYSEDIVSRRLFQIRLLDKKNQKLTELIISNTSGQMIWSSDSKSFYYVLKDEMLREYKLMCHTLGQSPENDVCIYEEKDDTFHIGISKSKSEKYLLVGSWSTLTTEFHYTSLEKNEAPLNQFIARRKGHEYSIDHDGKKWWIRSNDKAINFKLMSCDSSNTELENWNEEIAHRDDVLFEDFALFEKSLVVVERKNGLKNFRIIHHDGKSTDVQFNDPCYDADLGPNPELSSTVVRIAYSSLTMPLTQYDVDMQTGFLHMVKQQEIPGTFKGEDYIAERHFAKSKDGTVIPISLVFKKSGPALSERPLLLYGYGSYGISVDAGFNQTRLSLLDRDFIFAIAHIRGGEEMGRAWYNDGKLLKKRNTFEDFIASAEYLSSNSLCDSKNLFAFGGSAGGLLMGAIYNMRPDLWKGIVAAVPFVDVVTTMLDESIPLTTFEYDEWGNPNDKIYYDYMKSYSPYDNVSQQSYPAILITTGLHDSQVQYWEPAKWIAKLRWLNPNNLRPFYLYCDMSSGHGGASGRYNRYKEKAMEYSFLLSLAKSQ